MVIRKKEKREAGNFFLGLSDSRNYNNFIINFYNFHIKK